MEEMIHSSKIIAHHSVYTFQTELQRANKVNNIFIERLKYGSQRLET